MILLHGLSSIMILLGLGFSLHRAENVRSEVADASGNVEYNLNSLRNSPRRALVTVVLLNGIFFQTNFILR